MVKQIKKDAVESLTTKFKKAKSVVMTDYRGMTVAEMTNLRKALRAERIEYRIAKNRLARIAIKEAGSEAADEFLIGTTAIAFGYDDPFVPALILNEFAKTSEKLKFKGGLLDGKKINIATIEKLAKLPSKEQLLSRLLGSLQGPSSKLAMAINQAASKIVYALKAIEEQKKAQG